MKLADFYYKIRGNQKNFNYTEEWKLTKKLFALLLAIAMITFATASAYAYSYTIAGTDRDTPLFNDTITIDNTDNLGEILKVNINMVDRDVKTSYNKVLSRKVTLGDSQGHFLLLTDAKPPSRFYCAGSSGRF